MTTSVPRPFLGAKGIDGDRKLGEMEMHRCYNVQHEFEQAIEDRNCQLSGNRGVWVTLNDLPFSNLGISNQRNIELKDMELSPMDKMRKLYFAKSVPITGLIGGISGEETMFIH